MFGIHRKVYVGDLAQLTETMITKYRVFEMFVIIAAYNKVLIIKKTNPALLTGFV